MDAHPIVSTSQTHVLLGVEYSIPHWSTDQESGQWGEAQVYCLCCTPYKQHRRGDSGAGWGCVLLEGVSWWSWIAQVLLDSEGRVDLQELCNLFPDPPVHNVRVLGCSFKGQMSCKLPSIWCQSSLGQKQTLWSILRWPTKSQAMHDLKSFSWVARFCSLADIRCFMFFEYTNRGLDSLTWLTARLIALGQIITLASSMHQWTATAQFQCTHSVVFVPGLYLVLTRQVNGITSKNLLWIAGWTPSNKSVDSTG